MFRKRNEWEREREREFEGGMENSEGNCFVFVNSQLVLNFIWRVTD